MESDFQGTLQNMQATLRKPSFSLPRLRLGHITGAYPTSLTLRPNSLPYGRELRIRPSRCAKLPMDIIKE